MARPIVLIHGMWCNDATLANLKAVFVARGHTVHTPNLPHHQAGKTQPGVGAQSVRDYRAFLETYIRDQNFPQPPILIGHSMGGLLAQQLAATVNPFALVLLTPASGRGILALSLSNVLAFLRVFLVWGWWRKAHKPSAARARTSLYNGLAPLHQDRIYKTLCSESGRAVFEIGFWPLDFSRATAVDPASVKCPVFVVSAGQDKLTPPGVVQKVANLYPGAAHRYYAERSHWVIDDEDTERMANDIASWLQSKEVRARA